MKGIICLGGVIFTLVGIYLTQRTIKNCLKSLLGSMLKYRSVIPEAAISSY